MSQRKENLDSKSFKIKIEMLRTPCNISSMMSVKFRLQHVRTLNLLPISHKYGNPYRD